MAASLVPVEKADVQILLDFILEVICAADKGFYKFVMSG